jgi:8-oxo-dGTP diphosphatase
MKYCYEYPRPAVTVDGVILQRTKASFEILLVERKFDPYAGKWALPGGFIEADETAEAAIVREIAEETSLHELNFNQLFTVTELGRDPRGWTISIVYSAVSLDQSLTPRAADDAASVQWFAIDQLPPLAFDHHEILQKALPQLLKQHI